MPPLLRRGLWMGIPIQIIMCAVMQIGIQDFCRVWIQIIHKVIGDFSLDWMFINTDNLMAVDKRHLFILIA